MTMARLLWKIAVAEKMRGELAENNPKTIGGSVEEEQRRNDKAISTM